MMMAILPNLPRMRESSLQAGTRILLEGHALRRRARAPEDAMPVTLTPWSPSLHGVGFLPHLWLRACEAHEQVLVFGACAETLETFVQVYRQVELLVLHRTDHPEWWKDGLGVLAVAFLDDVDAPARARIHHFVYPDYRIPTVTTVLGHLVLQYAFEIRGLMELYGLTPVVNRAACRFARRLGFERVDVKLMTYGGQVVEGMETRLRRERWVARRALEG
jgi:hypothetical protein